MWSSETDTLSHDFHVGQMPISFGGCLVSDIYRNGIILWTEEGHLSKEWKKEVDYFEMSILW